MNSPPSERQKESNSTEIQIREWVGGIKPFRGLFMFRPKGLECVPFYLGASERIRGIRISTKYVG
jgi:hypothetical protein